MHNSRRSGFNTQNTNTVHKTIEIKMLHSYPSEVAPLWLLACQSPWEADRGQEEQAESGPAGSPKTDKHTND